MIAFCTDEHVLSVFITTLRSNDYDVVRATDVFGEGTDNTQLLEYSGEHDRILLTHHKKDFSGTVGGGCSSWDRHLYVSDISAARPGNSGSNA